MRRKAALCLFAGALALAPAAAQAQQPAPTGQLLAVGTMAPDFELQGATRYGQLAAPVKLSDYRGEVVVLAFFFRVRTPG
jgi:peroxiredoxin Q/BCP